MKKLLALLFFALTSVSSFAQSADGKFTTVTASGTNSYTITDPTPAQYDSKEKWLVTFTNASTGSVTLNRNSLGAKAVRDADGTQLGNGDICAGCRYFLTYNGTYYQRVGGGRGVTDGDKGDITVSSSGSVFDLDAGTVGVTELGSITSAELAGKISDETGTGSVVLSGSPALSGSPTAPTQTAADNSTKIATTAYVDANVYVGTWSDYTPSVTGFSTSPTVIGKYTIIGKTCFLFVSINSLGNSGTSNATTFTLTLPQAGVTYTGTSRVHNVAVLNSGTWVDGYIVPRSNSNIADVYITAFASFASSGQKGFVSMFFYELP